MKTDNALRQHIYPLRIVAKKHSYSFYPPHLPDKPDRWLFRFSAIDNKTVKDPANWDEAWFGNYE